MRITQKRGTTPVASRSRGWRFTHVAYLALFVGTLAACDQITSLDQEAPSRVIATDLYQPENAQLLVTSTISDFECALTQYIVAAGLVGDELIDAELNQAGWDYDRRTIVPSLAAYSTAQCGATQVPGYYTPLAIARATADKITTALEGWTDQQVPGRQALIATAADTRDTPSYCSASRVAPRQSTEDRSSPRCRSSPRRKRGSPKRSPPRRRPTIRTS